MDFYQILDKNQKSEFKSFVYNKIRHYNLLDGIEHNGNKLWEQLGLNTGKSLFELGPGYGLLMFKAALNGIHVVAVEHPQSNYIHYLKKYLEIFKKAFHDTGGDIELVLADILNPETRAYIHGKFGKNNFDYVCAIDVLRPRSIQSQKQIRVLSVSLNEFP